jgi:pimeloyl-ACP methyl ester carboxylesterase
LTVASRAPVVAAVGEKDRLCPSSNAQALVKAVGSGDAVVLPGAGHMLPLERPAEVARLVAGLVT